MSLTYLDGQQIRIYGCEDVLDDIIYTIVTSMKNSDATVYRVAHCGVLQNFAIIQKSSQWHCMQLTFNKITPISKIVLY